MQGDGEWGLQSVHHMLSLMLVPPQGGTPHTLPLLQREGSSHRRQFSTNFSIVNPSHGLQLFTNCLSVAPSHGVQCFRNRLLPRGSPTGSPALPAKRSGVGSSLHGSAAPARSLLQHGAPHSITASFRHPHAPAWGSLQRLQMDICSTVDLHGVQGDSLPHHGLSSRVAREGGSLLRHFGHLLPPLLH